MSVTGIPPCNPFVSGVIEKPALVRVPCGRLRSVCRHLRSWAPASAGEEDPACPSLPPTRFPGAGRRPVAQRTVEGGCASLPRPSLLGPGLRRGRRSGMSGLAAFALPRRRPGPSRATDGCGRRRFVTSPFATGPRPSPGKKIRHARACLPCASPAQAGAQSCNGRWRAIALCLLDFRSTTLATNGGKVHYPDRGRSVSAPRPISAICRP